MNEIRMSDWKEEILKKWEKSVRGPLITDALRSRLAREFKGEVFYKEPMNRHTSIRIGGNADVYLKPQDQNDLLTAVRLAREEGIPCLILGLGSNTLVKDGGIRGMVIATSTALQACCIVADHEDSADVLSEAGVGITTFVNYARDQSLTGMEALVGIPGTMGGAIVMNAGARGTEIKDIIRSVTLVDEGEVKTIPREKLEFEYRHLKIPRSAVVLSGLIRLQKGRREEIAEKIQNYQKMRTETQPLNYPNLGSMFKNPPRPKKGETPLFAAQLVEEAGLKGVRVGGARISEKHANFIVNEKEATAKDVTVLINLARDKVKEATGVLLETEIRIIGED